MVQSVISNKWRCVIQASCFASFFFFLSLINESHSELMKEDYSEIVHKKSEVIHLCNYCSQILERTEQM